MYGPYQNAMCIKYSYLLFIYLYVIHSQQKQHHPQRDETASWRENMLDVMMISESRCSKSLVSL